MEFRTGRPVKITERRHILTNFPGGGPPPRPPYENSSTPHRYVAGSSDGCLRPLLRSPPTLKVADNPGGNARWIVKLVKIILR